MFAAGRSSEVRVTLDELRAEILADQSPHSANSSTMMYDMLQQDFDTWYERIATNEAAQRGIDNLNRRIIAIISRKGEKQSHDTIAGLLRDLQQIIRSCHFEVYTPYIHQAFDQILGNIQYLMNPIRDHAGRMRPGREKIDFDHQVGELHDLYNSIRMESEMKHRDHQRRFANEPPRELPDDVQGDR